MIMIIAIFGVFIAIPYVVLIVSYFNRSRIWRNCDYECKAKVTKPLKGKKFEATFKDKDGVERTITVLDYQKHDSPQTFYKVGEEVTIRVDTLTYHDAVVGSDTSWTLLLTIVMFTIVLIAFFIVNFLKE